MPGQTPDYTAPPCFAGCCVGMQAGTLAAASCCVGQDMSRVPVAVQEQYDTAIQHFQQILDKQPDQWAALSQLIVLLKRAGKLSEADKYLEAMQAKHPHLASAPGVLCVGSSAAVGAGP